MSIISSLVSANTNDINKGSFNNEKRSVAKKACLACREKKIKCDGELVICYPSDPDTKTTSYKTCSNCNAASIECIFVPSKRGGRRKRKNDNISKFSKSENSSIISSTITSNNNNSNSNNIINNTNNHNHNHNHNNSENSTNANDDNFISTMRPNQYTLPDAQFNTKTNHSELIYPFPPQSLPNQWQQNNHQQQQQIYNMPASLNQTNNSQMLPQFQQPLKFNENDAYNQNNLTFQQQQQQQQQRLNDQPFPLQQAQRQQGKQLNMQQQQQQQQNLNPYYSGLYPVNYFNQSSNFDNDKLSSSFNHYNQQSLYPYPQYMYYHPDFQQQLLPYSQHIPYPYPPPIPTQSSPQLQSHNPLNQHSLPHPPINCLPLFQSQQINNKEQRDLINQNFEQQKILNPPQLPDIDSKIQYHTRQHKSIDFENRKSKHYIEKRSDNNNNSSFTDSSSNESDISPEDSIVNEKSKTVNDFDNTVKNNNEKDNDNDSWFSSLAPSDSVTMIGNKKKKQALQKFENNFNSIKESELENKNSSKAKINSSQSQSNSSNLASNLASNLNSNSSNPSSYDLSKPKSEISATEISTTEKWVDAQSNELKRSALENEHDLIQFKKKTKKYQPLKLNISLPMYLNDEILFKLKLPNFQTIYKLIGIYYKYYHPNNLILPNMSYFVENLSMSSNIIGLLAAMFKVSAKFLSHHEVDNDVWVDESYWSKIYEKYKDEQSILYRLISSIIQCQRGDDDYIKLCIEWINVIKIDESILNIPWQKYENMKTAEHASAGCILEREILIRTYWNVYKVYLFRRLSFGFPYNKLPEEPVFKLNKNVELPLPDIKYFNDTKDLSNFRENYNKNLRLTSISTTHPDGSKLFDSSCLVVSLNLLEEVINCVSSKTLFDYTILRFTRRLNKNFQIHNEFKHLQPYQLETHPKKEPHIIVNASNFTSTFINRLSCLILSISLCEKILVYPVKSSTQFKSQINAFDDLTLIEVDPNIINRKNKLLTSKEERLRSWIWFFKSLDVIKDLLILLQLGDGICSATLGEKKPIGEVFETLIGPCCSGSSIVEEWCKYNTWTMNVSNVPVENQGWIQMPSIVVWSMIQSWSIMSSFCVLISKFEIVFEECEVENEHDESNNDGNVSFSENEDEERTQVTKDAGRISCEADFRKKIKSNDYNIGTTYDKEYFENCKKLNISIIDKVTKEIIISGIPFESAPAIFCDIHKAQKTSNSSFNITLESMGIIRKYLGVLEQYYGDCKVGVVYCDKIIDYLLKLQSKC